MDIEEIHTLHLAGYLKRVAEELKTKHGISVSMGKRNLLVSKFAKDQYLIGFPAQRAAEFFAELYPEYKNEQFQ